MTTGLPNSSPPDDEYENPGHHDPTFKGPNSYNSEKSVLPINHRELWSKSILHTDGTRWTKEGYSKKAVYHRFSPSNGKWHWSGSTNGATNSGDAKAIELHNVPQAIKSL